MKKVGGRFLHRTEEEKQNKPFGLFLGLEEGVRSNFNTELLQIISTLSLYTQDFMNLLGMIPLRGNYFKLLVLN